MAYIVGVLVVIVAGESWLLWRVAVALNVLERFEERLAHLSGALHLLTDTAESGFASFAGALTEASQPPAARLKNGKRRRTLITPPAIAADRSRDVTEGELRLRLQMADIDRFSRVGEEA
jgi:hypothetical protein